MITLPTTLVTITGDCTSVVGRTADLVVGSFPQFWTAAGPRIQQVNFPTHTRYTFICSVPTGSSSLALAVITTLRLGVQRWLYWVAWLLVVTDLGFVVGNITMTDKPRRAKRMTPSATDVCSAGYIRVRGGASPYACLHHRTLLHPTTRYTRYTTYRYTTPTRPHLLPTCGHTATRYCRTCLPLAPCLPARTTRCTHFATPTAATSPCLPVPPSTPRTRLPPLLRTTAPQHHLPRYPACTAHACAGCLRTLHWRTLLPPRRAPLHAKKKPPARCGYYTFFAANCSLRIYYLPPPRCHSRSAGLITARYAMRIATILAVHNRLLSRNTAVVPPRRATWRLLPPTCACRLPSRSRSDTLLAAAFCYLLFHLRTPAAVPVAPPACRTAITSPHACHL